MSQATGFAPPQPLAALRDRLAAQPGLPFLDLLAPEAVDEACRRCHHPWRRRVYTPWITLGIFLSQVLSDDQSCDDAVARFQKYRHDQGLPAVGPQTGSYCEARQRLPEPLLWDLVRRTGRAVHQRAGDAWLFHGRSVQVVDG